MCLSAKLLNLAANAGGRVRTELAASLMGLGVLLSLELSEGENTALMCSSCLLCSPTAFLPPFVPFFLVLMTCFSCLSPHFSINTNSSNKIQ